ncbi:MAG: hypothetical protein IAX21_06160 [Candidatus Bathyarchaeota archaeon]|nr:MAG: hypothetical protein IAX21_06160 [Candidatus Bathyarchaeota archaeon]
MSEIKFNESELNNLDIHKSTEDLLKLVVTFFCSRNCNPEDHQDTDKLLNKILEHIEKNGLTYNQLNEFLLLAKQDPIGKGFFEYFFKKNPDSDIISVDELKEGINSFRGYSLLTFGNFRYAYNHLNRKDKEDIKTELEPYSTSSSYLENCYKNRHSKMLEIEKIPRDRTWFIGYITEKALSKETEFSEKLKESIEKGQNDYAFEKVEIEDFRKTLFKLEQNRRLTVKTALENTKIYLTWDYLDVYFATSMRNKWEFEDTWDFTKEVFENDDLKNLHVRYFDPTQSKCNNPREKGLVEGLMLKRSKCTIYLAQENDTMGKDSELAATLAQGKPVIAYVPRIDVKNHSTKIKKYPLIYFKNRLNMLIDEDSLDAATRQKIKNYDDNYDQTINSFRDELLDYLDKQPFRLWDAKNDDFKRNIENFDKVCMIISIAEHDYFENRAKLLNGRHPLSMQINLQNGVANGVLVVRNAKECGCLLYNLLVNKIDFEIQHKKEGYTILEEKISKSPFRVIINNEHLTNAFWNLFFFEG